MGHHLAHALSLLPVGLPPRSLIVVSDTTAERHAITVFYWTGSDMRRLWAVPWPHSPGLVFHQAALHAGFTGRTAPGKLMALSAHGCESRFPSLDALGRVVDGTFTLRGSHYPAWRRRGGAFSHYARQIAPGSVSEGIDRAKGALDEERTSRPQFRRGSLGSKSSCCSRRSAALETSTVCVCALLASLAARLSIVRPLVAWRGRVLGWVWRARS